MLAGMERIALHAQIAKIGASYLFCKPNWLASYVLTQPPKSFTLQT